MSTLRTPSQSVLIIGEHSLSRAFIRAWVGTLQGLRVLAEGPSSQALELVRKCRPKLVLIGLDTPGGADLKVLARLQSHYPAVKVIVYFSYLHDNIAIRVIRAGAAGFVVKSAHPDEMANAIRTALGGGIYLSPEFLRFVGKAEGLVDAQGKPFSRRQVDILGLVAQGLSTKAIAFELKLSGKTVDLHKQGMVRRLGMKKAVELYKYAVGAGLAPV